MSGFNVLECLSDKPIHAHTYSPLEEAAIRGATCSSTALNLYTYAHQQQCLKVRSGIYHLAKRGSDTLTAKVWGFYSSSK